MIWSAISPSHLNSLELAVLSFVEAMTYLVECLRLAAVSRVVATGRWIKGVERFIA